MIFKTCHNNKNIHDNILLSYISFDTLIQPLEIKSRSNRFAHVYIEGRSNYEFNAPEILAMLKSTRLYSQKFWPIYCFIYKENVGNFIEFLQTYDADILDKWNIVIQPLDESIDSRQKLNDFMVDKLFFILSDEHIWANIVQPDGYWITNNIKNELWEDFVDRINVPMLGAPWKHYAGIIYNEENQWYRFNADNTNFCNGGFSIRDIQKCRKASKLLKGVKLAEMGHPKYAPPPEDLRFGFTLYSLMGYTQPSKKDCQIFSSDPIDLEQFEAKQSFGFHCPIFV